MTKILQFDMNFSEMSYASHCDAFSWECLGAECYIMSNEAQQLWTISVIKIFELFMAWSLLKFKIFKNWILSTRNIRNCALIYLLISTSISYQLCLQWFCKLRDIKNLIMPFRDI